MESASTLWFAIVQVEGQECVPWTTDDMAVSDGSAGGSSPQCLARYRGAYWYTACHSSNLNGYQYVGNHTTYADGINWYNWRGHHYSLKRTSMKIRPTF
ncbi:Techylectin-5B [Portunus trituberculatus]|uniref:Techylectin-5B n=1 Tax=Portunus trituberculatus TaxID=210409 RepID=A0A5B7HE57_PORTR|nr:Techylectin-5B [Portunus trituberculatus]